MILTTDTSKIQTFPRVFLDSTQKIQKNTWKSKNSKKSCKSKDSVKIFGFLDFWICQCLSYSHCWYKSMVQSSGFEHIFFFYTGRLRALLTGSHPGRELQLGGGDIIPDPHFDLNTWRRHCSRQIEPPPTAIFQQNLYSGKIALM